MKETAATIHAHLADRARTIGPALADAIIAEGPVELPRPAPGEPLATRLCRAVAGQQLSTIAAGTIWRRVLTDAEPRALMPYLREATVDTLRQCGLSQAKALAMQTIAQADARGDLDAEALRALDHDARTRQLTTLRGVGPWTADMIGIFYFGDRDIWPDGDVTARKTLVRLTSRRRKTTRTAERFRPYRSYLAVHMWRHADRVPD